MPKRLTGVAGKHKGSANSPWTCYAPKVFTDEEGLSWEVLGVGGARVVLKDLGPGSGHLILKVGDAEQTQEEAFFFGKIARDFSYVTRPAAQGRVTIELQGP